MTAEKDYGTLYSYGYAARVRPNLHTEVKMNDKNKNSSNSTPNRQKNKLSAQSEAIMKILMERGLLEDDEISDDDIRQAVKAMKFKKFHNTQLLLKHYRDIKWVLECFPAQISEELDRPFVSLDTLLGLINAEIGMEDVKLENRLMNVQKTRLMLDRFHEAMSVLRQKPVNGEDLYNCLYLTFISPEDISHQDILNRLNISSRHYYRLRRQAISVLSIRLWGVPSAEFDSWLEILSLLEALNGKRNAL